MASSIRSTQRNLYYSQSSIQKPIEKKTAAVLRQRSRSLTSKKATDEDLLLTKLRETGLHFTFPSDFIERTALYDISAQTICGETEEWWLNPIHINGKRFEPPEEEKNTLFASLIDHLEKNVYRGELSSLKQAHLIQASLPIPTSKRASELVRLHIEPKINTFKETKPVKSRPSLINDEKKCLDLLQKEVAENWNNRTSLPREEVKKQLAIKLDLENCQKAIHVFPILQLMTRTAWASADVEKKLKQFFPGFYSGEKQRILFQPSKTLSIYNSCEAFTVTHTHTTFFLSEKTIKHVGSIVVEWTLNGHYTSQQLNPHLKISLLFHPEISPERKREILLQCNFENIQKHFHHQEGATSPPYQRARSFTNLTTPKPPSPLPVVRKKESEELIQYFFLTGISKKIPDSSSLSEISLTQIREALPYWEKITLKINQEIFIPQKGKTYLCSLLEKLDSNQIDPVYFSKQETLISTATFPIEDCQKQIPLFPLLQVMCPLAASESRRQLDSFFSSGRNTRLSSHSLSIRYYSPEVFIVEHHKEFLSDLLTINVTWKIHSDGKGQLSTHLKISPTLKKKLSFSEYNQLTTQFNSEKLKTYYS